MPPSPIQTNQAEKDAGTLGPADDAKLQLASAAALERLNAGDHQGVRAALVPVHALAATRSRASHVFGLFYLNIGETHEALAWFDRALELSPAFAEAQGARAIALQKLGRLEAALAALEAVLDIAPNHHEALYARGTILQGLDRKEEALAAYDKALRLKPDYGEALINRGAVLEQLGRLEEALRTCEAAVLQRPADATAHFNRGSVLQRLGHYAQALAAYEQARTHGGEDPEIALNCGNALQKLDRPEEALASYESALRLRPLYPQAHYNRGIALHRLARLPEALAAFDAALAQQPAYPDALCNRGNILNALRRYAEALASYDRALRLRPQFPQAEINRANVLFAQERYEAAIEACAALLARVPDQVQALCTRGAALHRAGRLEEALESLAHALRIKPDFAEAWLNRGNVLQELGRLDEALDDYDAALAIRPNYAEVLSSRGVALKELGLVDEALADFDAALMLKPDYADAHNNRAGALLLSGDFAGGFEAFESRWARSNAPRKVVNLTLATWRGEPLQGRRILVFDEQGLGDLIEFGRYLPMLADRGAEVTFLGRPSMFRLLATLPGAPYFIERIEDEREYDYQIALASLPYAFGTRRETIPAALPYLYAEPQRVAHWARRVGSTGFRIGICWRSTRTINLERNVPLACFEPLAATPGVRLISLMKEGDADIAAVGLPIETFGEALDTGPDAFLDTAAVMAHLDLIVTSDTSIAHLAGALGRPAYLALKHVPDWRWLMKGERSPWYPTLRLFRQAQRGDWAPVFERISVCVAERMRFPAG